MAWADIELALGLKSTRRILIIEDNVHFALRLNDYLSVAGHQVSGFSGIESGQLGKMIGIGPHKGEDTKIDLATFEVCFLDHYFAGIEFNGTTLMPLLLHPQIRVLGMSSVDSANESMRRQGAIMTLRKDKLAQLLSL